MMLYVTLALALCSSTALAKDCVDTLISTPKASTLVQLVTKAGLADALRGGQITIFAPTNDAFANVPQDVLGNLLTDNAALGDVLKYHVVGSKAMSTDITNEMKVATLQGGKIRLNIYSHEHVVSANGVNITEVDITCDNGVIHFVQGVLMPPTKTVVQLVAEDKDLSTLLSVVTAAGIANEFQADPMTLFAPTNAAFAKLEKCTLDLLTDPANKAYLEEVLEYHAVSDTLFAVGVYNREYERTIDEHQDRVRIRVDNNGVSINNAKVTTADIQATNGVIHKIDDVLIPIRTGFWVRAKCNNWFGGVGK